MTVSSSLERPKLHPQMTVDEIMRAFPATLTVMIRRHMLCIGCPIGGFHTLAEACSAHGLNEAEVLADLVQVVGAQTAISSAAPRQSTGGRARR